MCEVLGIFNTLQQKSLKLHLIFPHVELTDFGRTGLQAAGPSRSSPLGFSVSPDLSLLQRVEGTVSFGRGRDGGGGGASGRDLECAAEMLSEKSLRIPKNCVQNIVCRCAHAFLGKSP